MSFEIAIWKSSSEFDPEKVHAVYGSLCEEESKPKEVEYTDLIQKFIVAITETYPALDKNQEECVWSSSFICKENYFCSVSLTRSGEFTDVLTDMVLECRELGLIIYDPQNGEIL